MIKLGDLGIIKFTLSTSLKNLFEMEFLANISDIDNSVAFELIDSVSKSS